MGDTLYAIVVYKEGGDLPYEGIRSWKVVGNFVLLYPSRHEVIIVPSEAVTSIEIREDKEVDRE